MIICMQKKLKRAEEAAAVMKSLAHPKRLLMMCILSNKEMGVGELQAALGMGQAAVSQQLARLRAEGMVVGDKRGQQVVYRLADGRVKELLTAMGNIYCKDLLG